MPREHGRPRPVADAPVAALADGRLVAKAWLEELVVRAELHEAARLPLDDLARVGPTLARSLVTALGTDVELPRLRWASGAVGRLAAVRSPSGVVGAVEALRRATWTVLEAELRGADPRIATELAVRLGALAAEVAEAAVEALEADASGTGVPGPDAEHDPPSSATGTLGGPAEPDRAFDGAAEEPPPPPVDAPASTLAPGDLEDEEADRPTTIEDFLLRRRGPREEPEEDDEPEPSEPDPPVTGGSGPRGRFPVPGAHGPWLMAIDRRLARHAQDGRPFGVLLAEIDDLDRLVEAQQSDEVAAALGAAERALAQALRPADALVRERLGRYWVTAPDTGPATARLLGERLADAVAAAASLRGTPLAMSVGLACCPDDGLAPDALAGKAEEGVFAARSAGVRLA